MHEGPANPGGVVGSLARSRAATRRVLLAGIASCVIASAWAVYTPQREVPDVALASDRAAAAEPAPAPLDVAAFQTPVWTIAEPVKAAAAPPPPPPPPPLKLQLLGIVKEGEACRAVLYDPDANKVRVVAAGEELQGQLVDRITPDSVSIRNGAVVQVLALKSPGVTP